MIASWPTYESLAYRRRHLRRVCHRRYSHDPDHLSDGDYGRKAADVPWLVPGQGLATVWAFFQALTGLQFDKFQPKAIFGSGDIVVALIDVAFTVKATGRTVSESDEVHIWHFNEAGKVSRFTHKADTPPALARLAFPGTDRSRGMITQ